MEDRMKKGEERKRRGRDSAIKREEIVLQGY